MKANDLSTLNDIRGKNPDKLITGHLSFNSIRTKSDASASFVMGEDDASPTCKFLIPDVIKNMEMESVDGFFQLQGKICHLINTQIIEKKPWYMFPSWWFDVPWNLQILYLPIKM